MLKLFFLNANKNMWTKDVVNIPFYYNSIKILELINLVDMDDYILLFKKIVPRETKESIETTFL